MNNHWNCPTCVVIYCDQHRSAPAFFRQQPEQPKKPLEFEKYKELEKVQDPSVCLPVNGERREEDLRITNVVGNYGVEEDDVLIVAEVVNSSCCGNQRRDRTTDWDASQKPQEFEVEEGSHPQRDNFDCSNCDKTFQTKKGLSDHSRYHTSVECPEEPCCWTGPPKKFNVHLRKSHKINTVKGIKAARDRAGLHKTTGGKVCE